MKTYDILGLDRTDHKDGQAERERKAKVWVMPLLGELVRQKGRKFFETDPIRLQEQITWLGPQAFDHKTKAMFPTEFPLMTEESFDELRHFAMENAKHDTRKLCEVIGMLTEQQCTDLLQEAEDQWQSGYSLRFVMRRFRWVESRRFRLPNSEQ